MKVWPVIIQAVGSILLLIVAGLCLWILGANPPNGKNDGLGALIIPMMLCVVLSIVSLLVAIDNAKKLRDWVDPVKESSFRNEIPQDAIDRRWVVEIGKEFDSWYGIYYQSTYGDALDQTRQNADYTAKRNLISSLISSAKSARGVRLNLRVTAMKDD